MNYSNFFSIELLHEYFAGMKCNDLEILPAEDCRNISRRMNIQWRTTENRIQALIRENDNQEPFINAPQNKVYRKCYSNTVFRFYIKLKNTDFLNYTNIDLSSFGSKKKLYFSNLVHNKEGGKLYLSMPVEEYATNKAFIPGKLVKDQVSGHVFEAIKKHTFKKKSQLTDPLLWAPKGLLHLPKGVEDHNAGKTYSPGDLVRKPATDEVYESNRKHTSTAEVELGDESLWLSRGQGVIQYPTGNDVLECTTGNYTFTVAAPVTKAEISVFGFNYDAGNPAYDRQVGVSENRQFEKPATQVMVNLSTLGAGKYQIKVNKETRTLYHDPLLNAGNVIGIIEIFNHLPATDDYALLTEDEKIKYARYVIHFPNRRVLWKYVRKDSKAQSITDTGDTGYGFSLEGDDFVSTTPIPLSESVCKTLKLEFNTKDYRVFPLPNPPVQRLGKYTQHDYDYLCSEVYLNY